MAKAKKQIGLVQRPIKKFAPIFILPTFLAFIIGFGAVALFQRGTFLIGGERASVLSTVEPLTGVIVGAIVFEEQMTPFSFVGVVLVLSACVLIAMADNKAKEKTVKK